LQFAEFRDLFARSDPPYACSQQEKQYLTLFPSLTPLLIFIGRLHDFLKNNLTNLTKKSNENFFVKIFSGLCPEPRELFEKSSTKTQKIAHSRDFLVKHEVAYGFEGMCGKSHMSPASEAPANS